jgi:hypothetical protein
METSTTLVLTVQCGATLKTVINGQSVEIECTGDSEHGWTPPAPPSGGGGVVAYIRAAHEGPSLDLNALAERYEAGQLSADDLPLLSPEGEWAVFWGGEGEFRSMGPMTLGE